MSMTKQNFTGSLKKACISILFVFSSLTSSTIFAQSADSEDGVEKFAESIFLFLTSEIALQRGEVGAAYQTLLHLAKTTKDPRIAQRAMEVALLAKSPQLSLDAAKLWDELALPTDNTSREVYLTLLFINQRWEDAVGPTVKYLKTQSSTNRDQFLKQIQTFVSKAASQDEALMGFAKIVSQLIPVTNDPDILLMAALGEEKAGNIQKMEDILTSILKTHPNHASALNALGYSYADRNINLTVALDLITKADQLMPNDPYILDSVGWVNYRLGNLEIALKYLQDSFSKLEEAEVGAHLGEVLLQSGKPQEADIVWRKAESLNANNSTLKETLQRLRPSWAKSESLNDAKTSRWEGRFAVKINNAQNQNGGSGAFTLNHAQLSDVLEIRSPIGSAIAKIIIKPGSASLEQNGKIVTAIDADQLMAQTIGLPIPARGLAEWLSGFPRPGSNSSLVRDEQGQVAEIIQDGWTLKYNWSADKKIQKLSLNRSDNGREIEIRLIFDLIYD